MTDWIAYLGPVSETRSGVFHLKSAFAMKKAFHSTWFAVLLLIAFGTVAAYRRISRQQRANSRATQMRIESDVKSSIGNLKIEMKPLSEAGAAVESQAN